MDLVKRAYVGEKDRNAKNAKKYVLVRSALIGKQKRNIYIKDSKEYIKHNGKYIQFKNYMEMSLKKKELQLKKSQPCKKDCAAENKICNKKTRRCNKIKVKREKVAKKQKYEEIFQTIFLNFFLKNYTIWLEESEVLKIRKMILTDKNMARTILKDFARNIWDNDIKSYNKIGKSEFVMIVKRAIRKTKKPLQELTLEDINTAYLEYQHLRYLRNKRELKKEMEDS